MNNNNSDNNGKNGADARSAQLEEIKELGSVSSFDGKHKIYCLTIIGEIEGHNVLPEQTKTTKYEHVIPQLVAVEESMDAFLAYLPHAMDMLRNAVEDCARS